MLQKWIAGLACRLGLINLILMLLFEDPSWLPVL
jgi:hypothetical protein